MKIIKAATLQEWERFYRANFVNSLTGFKSVNLIGSISGSGIHNLGIFSSIVHIGSDPALVGYINRPREAAPDTISNIEATGSYTINHIQPQFIPQAHQTSAKYAPGISEFSEVGLTPQFEPGIAAPFVKESLVKYALALQQIIPITFNNSFLVIGKIEYIMIEENLVTADGFLQLDKAATICSNGVDSYYLPAPIGRFAYAKPHLDPKKINQ